MSDERKASVQSYRNEYDKKRTVLGEHLARKGISDFLGIDGTEIRFERDKQGRPFAVGLDVDFNVSHSNELVVCAVSNERVGVDVECFRDIDLRVTKIACTEREKDFVFTAELPDEQRHNFFLIWTAKEAYLKFLGTGLTGLKSIEYDEIKPYCEVFVDGQYIITVYQNTQ